MVDGGEQTQGVIFFIGNRRPTDRELREIPVSLLRTVEDVQEFNAWLAEVRRRGDIIQRYYLGRCGNIYLVVNGYLFAYRFHINPGYDNNNQ